MSTSGGTSISGGASTSGGVSTSCGGIGRGSVSCIVVDFGCI